MAFWRFMKAVTEAVKETGRKCPHCHASEKWWFYGASGAVVCLKCKHDPFLLCGEMERRYGQPPDCSACRKGA